MQQTAPAGTVVYIQEIPYELVNDTVIEGSTPFKSNRYYPPIIRAESHRLMDSSDASQTKLPQISQMSKPEFSAK